MKNVKQDYTCKFISFNRLHFEKCKGKNYFVKFMTTVINASCRRGVNWINFISDIKSGQQSADNLKRVSANDSFITSDIVLFSSVTKIS